LLHHQYPVHRFLHSFLGAGAAGLVAVGAWLLIVRAATAVRPKLMLSLTGATSPVRSEFSLLGAIAGGLIGGLSHPFFDGIMHPDVRPFMPFSDRNPFLGLIGVGALHMACVAAAVVGLIGMALWRTRVGPTRS
jgi:membrane-bound metal-dependent hydrolase YbcI (DUF457 family)